MTSAWDSGEDWNWVWKRSRIWVDSGQLDNWMAGQWPRQAKSVHQKFSEAKSPEKERQIGSDRGVTGRVSVKKVDASMKNTNEQPEQNAVGQQAGQPPDTDTAQIELQMRDRTSGEVRLHMYVSIWIMERLKRIKLSANGATEKEAT